MYDYVDYMENVAVKLKELRHTDDSKKFYRISNITFLEELLQNLTDNGIKDYILIVEDNMEGRFDDNSANALSDDQYYSFYIAKNIELNNFDDRQAAIKQCMVIIKKIYSKMFRDRANDNKGALNQTGLRNLDRSKISYQTVGPFAENFHGIMTSFIVSPSAGIKYDENDWDS